MVKFITVCLCLWPSTRNCGNSTSLLIPTLFDPEFHLYRISLIVYPTKPAAAARTDKACHSSARMHISFAIYPQALHYFGPLRCTIVAKLWAERSCIMILVKLISYYTILLCCLILLSTMWKFNELLNIIIFYKKNWNVLLIIWCYIKIKSFEKKSENYN